MIIELIEEMGGVVISIHTNKWDSTYAVVKIDGKEFVIRNSDHDSFNNMSEIDIVGVFEKEFLKDEIEKRIVFWNKQKNNEEIKMHKRRISTIEKS